MDNNGVNFYIFVNNSIVQTTGRSGGSRTSQMGCTKRKRNEIFVCVSNSKKIGLFSRQLVLELGSRSHCITPTPKCNDHVNWIQIQLLLAMDPGLALVAFKSISSIN